MALPDALLDPTSVAIVGLSDDPAKHGGRVLANLRRLGYAGTVHGVNPRLPDVEGVEVVASLGDLDAPPDVVVCAVPGPAVAGVVEDAGKAGAAAVVVFAGGFAEAGEDGRSAQQALADIASRCGVAVLGPNSGGVIRASRGLALSFLTCLDRPVHQVRSGPVGVVTQSGGIGSHLHNLAAERGGGLAVSVSVGNEAGIDVAAGIAALTRLGEVRAIAVVLETVRDGPAFVEAVRGAWDAGKPVVACRLGRSRRGRRLMTTHTGALAGEARVLDGVLDHLGVSVADTPGEMFDLAEVLARTARPAGGRAGIVTHSGGIAILLSDLSERLGVHLPDPGTDLGERLVPLLDHGAADNPLDMGGIIGGPHRFAEVVDACAGSGDYDVVLAVSSAHPPAHTMSRVEALVARPPAVPVIHLWMAGDVGKAGLEALRTGDYPVTEDPKVAVAALAALGRRAGIAAADPGMAVAPAPALPMADGSGQLGEHRSKVFLAERGLPMVEGRLAITAADAVAIAGELGYPVAVKASFPDLPHKTEAGAVRLGVGDPDGVAAAFDEVLAAAREALQHGDRFPAAGEGVRVERMRSGIEMVVGAVSDPVFGPVVLVGAGGIHAEALDDVAVAPAPVSPAGAARMIERLSTRGLLSSSRGGRPPDVDQLASIVSAVGALLVAHRFQIAEIEINPLAWTGDGWEGLDALVRLADDE